MLLVSYKPTFHFYQDAESSQKVYMITALIRHKKRLVLYLADILFAGNDTPLAYSHFCS